MVQITLLPEFGYVILGIVSTFFLNFWLGFQVTKARKKHDVTYPTFYENSKPEFNCIQRGHQNSLEYVPFLHATSLLGGLFHPTLAAAGIVVWIIGRVIYMLGYSTGSPGKRAPGFILSIVGLLLTTVSAVWTAGTLLGWF